MLAYDLAERHDLPREEASMVMGSMIRRARSMQSLVAASAILAGAPALGQCLDTELGEDPSFPVPPGVEMNQVQVTAQVAPPGSPPGELELFRLWSAPAVLEVLRVSATGAVTPVQNVRLRSAATAPAITYADQLAVDGDWLMVSTRDLVSWNAVDQGKVLVYQRTGGQWTFAQSLMPSGAPARFGSSLALVGDRVLVGDQLASTVHVFDRSAAGWQESAVVQDPAVGSLALSGDRFLVGRPSGLVSTIVPGARIYERNTLGNWGLSASIAPPAGAHPMYFSLGLALEADTVMLGDGTVASPLFENGAVFVYSRVAAGWAQVDILRAPSDLDGSYGAPIVLYGSDLVVGGGYRGVARYRNVGGTWVNEATFGRDSRVDAGGGLAIAGARIVTGTHVGGVQVVPWTPRGGIDMGCVAHPNSSGATVRLEATTTPSASGAPFELVVQFSTGTPGVNGLFLAGPSAAQLPFGGGELCVGGVIARLGPGAFLSSFLGTEMHVLRLDPTLVPGLIQPGATVHFQYWYPDQAGNPRGNLSNSLVVTYCP
jgi:hypothetical protein